MPPAVRLFGFDGAHVRDIGAQGEGPGEYTRPEQVATSAAGRFRPARVWNLTPTGNLLAGASDAYRFEVSATSGTAMVVEKAWEPVPVAAEEASYFEYLATLGDNARPVSPIPDTKPAFLALLGAATGETWVLRQGRGFKLPGCNDRPASQEEMVAAGQPCWLDRLFFDVFGSDGRFLGRVDARDEMVDQILRWARTPHFAGDRVTAVAIDEAGTIMVKRYRLVLPGER